MLRLGIIGAENSHSYSIGNLCNVDKVVPMRVTAIWGETAAFARDAAEKGAIPEIVKDWRDLLGKVDGVMIDHRHPAPHYGPARFFIEQGVPVFVDKPFTFTLREGIKLLDLAEARKVPVCTFSSVPLQPAFQQFKKDLGKSGKVGALNVTGPVDIKSKYGGIFFYGIHQVDSMVELLGPGVKSAFLQRNGDNGVATVMYADGAVVTMNCIKQGGGGFHWRACTEKGILSYESPKGGNPYLTSVKTLHKFLKTRTSPFPRERMLAPVAVLEALAKSLAAGKPVPVKKFA